MFVAGIFQWLSGNPTSNWPAFDGQAPTLDPRTFAFGTLRFGDPVESARTLGKPDACHRSGNKVTLDYAGAGFKLEFAFDKLHALDIVFRKPGENESALNESALDVRIPLGNGIVLSRSTDRGQIRGLFGEPDDVDDIPEEDYISFNYERDPFDWEVDFDASGRLTAIHISGNLERL